MKKRPCFSGNLVSSESKLSAFDLFSIFLSSLGWCVSWAWAAYSVLVGEGDTWRTLSCLWLSWCCFRLEALLASHGDTMAWSAHQEALPADSASDTTEPPRFGCSSSGWGDPPCSPWPQSHLCPGTGDPRQQASQTESLLLSYHPRGCRHV